MQQNSPHSSPRYGQDRHKREYSAVSALTEVSVEDVETRRDARTESLDSFPEEQQNSNLTKSTQKLKLIDLDEAGPLESEAETCILKALEEKEEKRALRPSTGSTVLPHVPDEGIDSLIGTNNEEKPKAMSSIKSSRRRSSIVMPPADGNLQTELEELTNAMQGIRKDPGGEPPAPKHSDLGDFNRPHSLVHNADVLFHRSLKRRQGTRRLRTSATTDNVNDATQKHQWNIFRNRDDAGDKVSHEGERDPEVGQAAHGESAEESQDNHKRKGFRRTAKGRVQYTGCTVFLRKRWKKIRKYLGTAIFFMIIPILGISALFFRLAGNPPMRNRTTTVSYMANFVARHVVLCCLSLATQFVVIDLVAVRTRFFLRVFGQMFTLILIQSHGLPFLVFFWALYASAMTTGKNEFAKHWLFWQNKIPMFTAANDDGGLTTEQTYFDVLNASLFFGIAVLVKRVLLGIYIGKRMYARYGDQLADVMRQMLLVSEVACLAQGIEAGLTGNDLGYRESAVSFTIPASVEKSVGNKDEDDEDSITLVNVSSETNLENKKVIDATKIDMLTGSLKMSQRMQIRDLLGDWEEPKRERKEQAKISMRSVLQFRQAMKLTDVDYPFSAAFGLADSRESCIASSQQVYERLLSNSPGSKLLDFDTIAVLATTEDGNVDQEKLKELLRLFRPDREGKLTMVDFVRSIDSVYKSVRLLRASVENSGQIDHAFEIIINVCFYVLLFVIIVAVMGLNPLSLILSISSLVLSFAFMIGSASSKAFEGVLFVLLRRPFDIGDRIHVSPIDQDTSRDGSSTWFVEKVDLFKTQMRYATTNEIATATNGSMANSRIINAARSKNPVVYVFMKFGVDIPYRKVKIFRATVEGFVKQRPRQWLAMTGFRATQVAQDLGFIEYVIVLQHRGSWQQVGPILNSKAEFSSFALEVAKKLDMRYKPPGLSVDLTTVRTKDSDSEGTANQDAAASETGTTDRPPDMTEVAALFTKAKG